jgi:hypothetical protein
MVASASVSIPDGGRKSPPVQRMGTASGRSHVASTADTTADEVGTVRDLPVPGAEALTQVTPPHGHAS